MKGRTEGSTLDVAIVGGGIVGLAFALEASRRGMSVALFERHAKADGASVRNFGLIWPIGMPRGPVLDRALRGRERWLELGEEASFWVEESGSLHLAYHDDELALLAEFCDLEGDARELRLLEPHEVLSLSPNVNPDGLRGGLHDAADLRVDPRQAITALTGWIRQRDEVEVHPGTGVRRVVDGNVETDDGRRFAAERVFVCGGDDFTTLFPEVFRASGLVRCRLQMMRTGPQPADWRLGPTIATGLSLIRYDSLAACPSLSTVRARLGRESAEYLRHGIHILAAQNELGEVLLGDSHEYGIEFAAESRAEIDDLILAYLRRVLHLPDPRIAARWHGTYAKDRESAKDPAGDSGVFVAHPTSGVTIVIVSGGAGMTTAFGLAEEILDQGGLERGPPPAR